MSSSSNTWRLERSGPVRADAEGLFVPASQLPRAVLGDTVIVVGADGGDSRTGTIVETLDRDAEAYFRLELMP